MELGLADKVALVGGGGRGLGRAAAEALAAERAAVAIFGRGMNALETAAAEIAQRTGARVVPIAADVTSAADCRRVVAVTVAELGGLDVLVTNMGGPPTDFIAAGDYVIVSTHQRGKGRGSGAVVDLDVAVLYKLEDGRITLYREYHSLEEALEAAGSGSA